MTDLREGFSIHSPVVFVPWRMSEAKLQYLFEPQRLHRVTKGYYVADCEPFKGLFCAVGFHFNGPDELDELEFFRRSYPDLEDSYREFQKHLECAFGTPSQTDDLETEFPSHAWIVPGARIVHHVRDRFGPEEHVRIARV